MNRTGKSRPGLAAPIAVLVVIVVGILLAVASHRLRPFRTPAPAEGMVLVPAGTFVMGSDVGADDERPRREVYLGAFYIDKYEVTNGEYVEFLNAVEDHLERCGGHVCIDTKDEDPDSHILYKAGRYTVETGYENHPVIKVSWYGAKAYCEYYGKRLPSEAEWEKAARGTDGRVYPWGDKFDAHKANTDYKVGDTTPVGSYPEGISPYGAYDMAGNVWEWVADWYQAYPGSDYRSDFFGQKYKVVRGGSWNHPGDDARCSYRDIAHPARRILVVGFRCTKSP
jgi:formylglycine-generating enzyme required for sulfatase activity